MEETPFTKEGRPARKAKGTTAELRVAVELLDHGFSVSWPVGDMDSYDLIADCQNRLTRIQVKSLTNPNRAGTYKVSFRRGHGHTKKYTEADVDYFVAVLNYKSGAAFYVIPVSDVPSTAIFFPPNEHPRYPRRKTCKMEKWRGRWDLLR
tara:strand:- start:2371 stop:2820 length:450 start_codon:yes stop_codon:yes gene_type:complete